MSLCFSDHNTRDETMRGTPRPLKNHHIHHHPKKKNNAVCSKPQNSREKFGMAQEHKKDQRRRKQQKKKQVHALLNYCSPRHGSTGTVRVPEG
ncbi:hypothetical protein GQ55_1G316200 [Panicum hallii var. hallii]|uniref:Uncharacterized protein n=1 Tax=Panicum hallii var. hallii TaxID=1504633 RepID=A0A2T7F9K1_9POAL|nr:hypothetical protein GQ55_1G316200 [Panicum hallii var. hallii]